MAILRVLTHWIGTPGGPAGAPTTAPASLAAYTPAPPQLTVLGAAPVGTTPKFVQSWATNLVVTVWAELAKQNDIDSASWGGPGWPGGPPNPWGWPPQVSGDEGYSSIASTFSVTGISIVLVGVNNTEFIFTVFDPANNKVGQVLPTSPASAPGVYPLVGFGGPIAPVPNGRGIWKVEIQRKPLSGVLEPALFLGGPPGNPVQPTFVSPYGDQFEGILGLAFEGEEPPPPPCPTVTPSVDVPPCNPDGTRPPIELRIDFSFPLPAGTSYSVLWSPANGPAVSVSGTVPVGSTLARLTRFVPYSAAPSSFYPSASGTVTLPGQMPCPLFAVNFEYPVGAGSLTIPQCVPPVCHSVALTSNYAGQCLNAVDSLSLRFTAVTTPSSPAYTGSYIWEVSKAGSPFAGPFVQLPSAANPNQFDYTFVGPGPYSVSVTIETPKPPCMTATRTASVPVNIPSCSCPSITGVTANPSSGNAPLTVNLQANVTNPGAIVPDAQGNLYHWDFGDGTTADTPTPNISHPYANPGPFTATVTVAVPSGCPATIKGASVTVTQAPSCPSLTGLTATPSSGSVPLAVNFQASVTNPGAIVPDAQGNLYHWIFGDGTTDHTLTPNTSHTYASSGPFTATVTVNVPTGCPATTQNTSVTPMAGGGGFDICCFLIWWWGISHMVAGSLLYLGLWWAGIISSAIATIVLVIWIAGCCWPCALTPWKCCTLLRWVIMFNNALLAIFGLLAASPGGLVGNAWVAAAFGAVSIIVGLAMAASKCGAIPNIFDPTTWPPCRCP